MNCFNSYTKTAIHSIIIIPMSRILVIVFIALSQFGNAQDFIITELLRNLD